MDARIKSGHDISFVDMPSRSRRDERSPVEHRHNINPVALLGVRLVVAPAVNGRGTSPMHAYIVGGRR